MHCITAKNMMSDTWQEEQHTSIRELSFELLIRVKQWNPSGSRLVNLCVRVVVDGCRA